MMNTRGSITGGGRRQRGFTLLEVMVALLIFGVGLLTVAALQTVSKRANYEALQRTTASFLAMDMMERMRVNKRRLSFYIQGTMELGGGTRAVPATLCTTVAENCDGIDMSRVDLWEFERRLDGVAEDLGGAATGGLVSPTACIDGPGGGGTGVYTVAIAWRGVTELTYQADNPDLDLDCGVGSGLYGANDEFRRYLVVRGFIDAS
jgi:type IV pilus assembly protein PilV